MGDNDKKVSVFPRILWISPDYRCFFFLFTRDFSWAFFRLMVSFSIAIRLHSTVLELECVCVCALCECVAQPACACVCVCALYKNWSKLYIIPKKSRHIKCV